MLEDVSLSLCSNRGRGVSEQALLAAAEDLHMLQHYSQSSTLLAFILDFHTSIPSEVAISHDKHATA